MANERPVLKTQDRCTWGTSTYKNLESTDPTPMDLVLSFTYLSIWNLCVCMCSHVCTCDGYRCMHAKACCGQRISSGVGLFLLPCLRQVLSCYSPWTLEDSSVSYLATLHWPSGFISMYTSASMSSSFFFAWVVRIKPRSSLLTRQELYRLSPLPSI